MIITLNAQTVRAAATFAGTDDIRPILTTVYIERKDDHTIGITATDSYRLISFEQKQEDVLPMFDAFMLPKDAYKQITSKDDLLHIEFYDDNRQTFDVCFIEYKKTAYMQTVNTQRTTHAQCIEGKYPDYKRLLEAQDDHKGNSAGLNSAYLIDLGKCMEIAFGKHTKKQSAPPVCIDIIDALKPVHFTCTKDSLSCHGLIMPIRMN